MHSLCGIFQGLCSRIGFGTQVVCAVLVLTGTVFEFHRFVWSRHVLHSTPIIPTSLTGGKTLPCTCNYYSDQRPL
jgi:hypothetical protein